MRDIKNVIVEGISLVTKDYTPAVPKAETRFALFKAQPKWMTKIKKVFGLTENTEQVSKSFRKRRIIKAEQKEALRKISLSLIKVGK